MDDNRYNDNTYNENEYKSIDSYKPTGNLVYNTKLNDIDRKLFNISS